LIISGPSVVAFDNKLYEQFHPRIPGLVEIQRRHCSGYLEEAKRLLKKLELEKEKDARSEAVANLRQEIGLRFTGLKSERQRCRFLSLMEDPDTTSGHDVELELHADQSKKTLYGTKRNSFCCR
jgi:hypothetical protein